MFMSDFPLIAVTDAVSCPRPLLEQITRLAASPLRPAAILLRAKALKSADYQALAAAANKICIENNIPLILHSNWQLANELNINKLHLPLALLRTLPQNERKNFTWLSTSVHSVSEAKKAQALGATVLIAGHIYATQCKPGLAPRGLEFLQAAANAVPLPVYAIGGIAFDTLQHAELKAYGARGACVMSAYMRL